MAGVLLFSLFMTVSCPHCTLDTSKESPRPNIVRSGRFYRRSDSRWVQRFSCRNCSRSFSHATSHPCYRQKKRQMNEPLRRLLVSGVSQRRAALILNLNRTTVVRKFRFLAAISRLTFQHALERSPLATTVEFDDMETFEHSKCKPLSITLAVESKSRRILGFRVSRMPAKGTLAHTARKKYGPRPDERPKARKELFSHIKPFIAIGAEIKSDQNPHYPKDVKAFFPLSQHRAFKGRRGCVVGQGELKRGGFDPLFSLNHTCAKLRADINRLFRRTWCTTKIPERLADHIAIYAEFHNASLR